jgi:hypothetical protein
MPVTPGVPTTPLAAPSAGDDTNSVSQPPVVAVLKDGRRLSIESYAVMNGYLWDFSKQPVRKIPVGSIDVAESIKASEANGTEFPDIGAPSRVTVSH